LEFELFFKNDIKSVVSLFLKKYYEINKLKQKYKKTAMEAETGPFENNSFFICSFNLFSSESYIG
jgi:hypothetical protein